MVIGLQMISYWYWNWYAILLLTLRAMAMSEPMAKSLNYYGWFISIPISWIMNIESPIYEDTETDRGKMCIKDCFQCYPRTNHPTTIIINYVPHVFALKLPWMTPKKKHITLGKATCNGDFPHQHGRNVAIDWCLLSTPNHMSTQQYIKFGTISSIYTYPGRQCWSLPPTRTMLMFGLVKHRHSQCWCLTPVKISTDLGSAMKCKIIIHVM